MILDSRTLAVRPASPTDALLRLSEVQALLGCSNSTLRRYGDSGKLQCVVLPSGHRRFRRSDVERLMGIGEEQRGKHGGAARVAVVGRVSTPNQAKARGTSDKDDLSRQTERLTAWCEEKWGGNVQITKYVRVASGMAFSHPVLTSLCHDILAGKFDCIVATYPDRIIRFGKELFQTICEFGGAELHFTESECDVSDTEELSQDVIAILTHYAAKTHGKRAAKALSVIPTDKALQRIYQLHLAGHSNHFIANTLAKEDLGTDAKGRSVTKHVVARIVRQNRKQWAKLRNEHTSLAVHSDGHSFAEFCRDVLRVCDETSKAKLSQKALLAAYQRWVQANAKGEPLTEYGCRLYLKKWLKQKPLVQRIHDDLGAIVYRRLALITNGA